MLASVRRVGQTNKEHQVKGEDHLLQSLTILICESKQAKQSPRCRSLGRAAVEQLSLLSGGDGQTASLADGSGECCVPSDAASVTKQPHMRGSVGVSSPGLCRAAEAVCPCYL